MPAERRFGVEAAPRAQGRSGGSAGNERLTAVTGAALIALLAVEGVTILFIRPLISVHVFVGLMLVPPVALKLASTGWRFARYYAGSRAYVLKGPPHALMRFAVAPAVVVTTAFLFGTGVAMLAVRPQRGPLLELHKASFVLWLVVTGAHVLWHLPRLAGLLGGELSRRTRVPAARLRLALVGGSIALGAVLAASAFHLAAPWLDWVRLGR